MWSYMGFYDNLNSARRVGEVFDQITKQQANEHRCAQDSIEQRKKFVNAQLNSADDLRKMLEMMEANQKEQAIEGKKTKLISIWGLVISGVTLAATIIFGILQVIR